MQKLRYIIALLLIYPSLSNGQACGAGVYSLKVFTPEEQKEFEYQLYQVSKEKVDSLAKYKLKIKNWTKNRPIGNGIVIDSALADLLTENAYETALKTDIDKNIIKVYTPELATGLALLRIIDEEKSIVIITYAGGCATSNNALVWNKNPYTMRIDYDKSLEKLRLNNKTYVASIGNKRNILSSSKERSILIDSISIVKKYNQNLDFKIIKKDTFQYIFYHQDFPKSFKTIPPPDSLKDYEAYLVYDLVYDELKDKDINNVAEIEKLLSSYRTWYEGGKVAASNDGKVKIFTVEGQSCGAHCTPEHESFIHLKTQEGTKRIKPYRFYPVDNIYKIDTDKYLVLQSGVNGGGLFIDDIKRITCLSFDGYRLKYHVIDSSAPHSSEYDGSVEFHQNALFKFPNEFMLDYDAVEKIITYGYNEFDERGSSNRGFMVNGKYQYADGKFLKLQEERTAFQLKNH